MADWFKSYENDLDDEKLQWAMGEQQQVAIVYFALLSRCCRDKSGTLSWSGDELELFALSNKLRVSVPIVNQCLQLLVRIKFIELSKNRLKVLSWNDRQSEYCQRKNKLPTVSRHSPDSVAREEMRGDQIRKEGEEKPPINGTPTKADRIIYDNALKRVETRLRDIKEADMPGFAEERKTLKTEKSRLLGLLGLKA